MQAQRIYDVYGGYITLRLQDLLPEIVILVQ